jgi:hypothetical protein
MLTVEIYHSFDQIEADIQMALEELLSPYMPSLKWLEQYELRNKDHGQFDYYLFLVSFKILR